MESYEQRLWSMLKQRNAADSMGGPGANRLRSPPSDVLGAVITPNLVDVRYDPKHYNGRGGWRVELQYPGKKETDVISLTNEQAGNEREAFNIAAKTLIALEQFPDRAFEALNLMAKGKTPNPQAMAKGEDICKGKVLRQVEGLQEGVDGFHVVIFGEEPGEKPITTGPFATKEEAQRFLDAEVGAPNAQ